MAHLILYDAHCHLARDANLAAIPPPLCASTEKAEGRLLCATCPDDWDFIQEAAAVWPGTTPALGIHPWHAAGKFPLGWPDRLAEALRRHPSAWVGEIGLDGAKHALALKKFQEEVFIQQLTVAKNLARPITLHCVKSADRILELLDLHYLSSPRPFIIHSYNGPQQYIPPFLERGAYFTAGPHQTREGFSARIRGRARLIPTDRVLLESDSFLFLHHDAAQILLDSLQWLAEIKNVYLPDLAKIVAANVRKLFYADAPGQKEG